MRADIKSVQTTRAYIHLFLCLSVPMLNWTVQYWCLYNIHTAGVFGLLFIVCASVQYLQASRLSMVFKYTCLKIKCISFHFVPRRLLPFNSACTAAANLLLIIKTRESQVGSRIKNSRSRQIPDFLDFILHVHVPLFSKTSGSVLTSQRLWFAVTKDPCCKIGSANKIKNCRKNYEIFLW